MIIGYWGVAIFFIVVISLLFMVFVVLNLWFIFRGWKEVYYARRENRLATQGVYKIIRHPQYLGILLAIFGEGVVHWPTLFSVLIFPIIVFVYVRLARKEENKLLKKFGDKYRLYATATPAFIPSLASFKSRNRNT